MEVTAANATRMQPACATELYARTRLTFVCTSAPRVPANIVSAASAQKAQNHKGVAAGTVGKSRSNTANPAAFCPPAHRRVTVVGAPPQKSDGHHELCARSPLTA